MFEIRRIFSSSVFEASDIEAFHAPEEKRERDKRRQDDLRLWAGTRNAIISGLADWLAPVYGKTEKARGSRTGKQQQEKNKKLQQVTPEIFHKIQKRKI